MRILNAFGALILLAPLCCWADAGQDADVFGNLIKKRAELIESEFNLKIQSNNKQATGNAPSNAVPLPGAKQDLDSAEPVVEAIWGFEGKEVAEVNYKGRRISVSMQEPFISEIDGWKLAAIKEFEIVLVQQAEGRVVRKKTVRLSWGGAGAHSGAVTTSAQPVITPSIR